MNHLLSYLAEHFDLPILDFIAENLCCGFLDAIMPVITALGNAGIIWIIAAVVLICIPKYRKAGFAMGAALVLGLLVCNILLKPLVARPRPYDYQFTHFGKVIPLLIAKPTDFSFPSGHTIASFEAATVLMLHNRKMGISAVILASLIAFSRLYLYVHYPTDVLFSVALGVGFGLLGSYLIGRIYKTKE